MNKPARIVLILIAVFGISATIAGPAAAAPANATRPSTASVRHIEWNRPTRLTDLRARTSAHSVSPMAAVSCYGNTAYPVVYGGLDTWADNTLHDSGIVAKVQYWYCKRYANDPIGINFTQGWVEVYQNTWNIEFGQYWSYQWDGASLHQNGCAGCMNAPYYYGDGLGHTQINNLTAGWRVYDESNPGAGNLRWSAQFWVLVTRTDTGAQTTLAAMSPTF